MSATIKYSLIVLGLLLIGGAAYYLLVTSSTDTVSFESNEAVTQNMLANSQLFIDRREKLEAVSLDTSLFTNERFTSLRPFVAQVPPQPVGRPDPFAPANVPN